MKKFVKFVGTVIVLSSYLILCFGAGLGVVRLLKNRVNQAVVDNKIGRPTVKLGSIIRLVQDGRTYCSGVVIDNNTIVTAAHCVLTDTPFGPFLNPEAEIEIRASDNVSRGTFAHPKNASTQIDRAVLKGNFSIYSKSKYISDVAQSVAARTPGNRFISCGYPLGGALYCGNMIYQRELAFFMVVKSATAPGVSGGILIPGMSGGPTMLTDGTVIGINSAVEDDHSILAPMYNVEMYK